VPALVVHCLNEVEARGLEEVGIYRVPGSEREVKELKEKFLAGRGCPNLGQIDVHVLCGVVKDFLRTLREPLIPNSMWSQFTEAANNPDLTDAESQLCQAVSELPPPNRDTLAFFMVHLQKVAGSKACKMNVSNLGKILGPTVVGYRSLDPQPEDMLKELGVIQCTMEKLINLNTDYWETYLKSTEGKNLFKDNQFMSPLAHEPSIFRTPYADTSMAPGWAQYSGNLVNAGGEPGRRIFASPVILDDM